MNRTRDVLLDLLRTALVTLLALAALEAGLRIVGYKSEASFFTDDAERGFAFRPGAEGWSLNENTVYLRINSAGFRDTERQVDAAPGVERIAVVGSSYVSARHVLQEETFPALMERRLTSSGHQVEVLNLGMDAYNPEQVLQTLRRDVWRYHPKIVLYAFNSLDILNGARATNNDGIGRPAPFFALGPTGELIPDRRSLPSVDPSTLRWHNAAWDTINRSELLLAASHAIRNVVKRFGPPLARPIPGLTEVLPLLPPPQNGPMEASWLIFEKTLKLMADDVAAHGAELWAVYIGQHQQVTPDLEFREAYRTKIGAADLSYPDHRLRDMLHGTSITYIDLTEPMSHYAITHKQHLHGAPQHNGHWNAEGHRVAAEILSRRLEERLAPPKPAPGNLWTSPPSRF